MTLGSNDNYYNIFANSDNVNDLLFFLEFYYPGR